MGNPTKVPNMMKLVMRFLNSFLKILQRTLNSPLHRALKLTHPSYRDVLKAKRLFLDLGGKIDSEFLELDDIQDSAGNAKGHYFHQDLLVARLIHEKNPALHLDIGSRIDGFVAHVASFRKISVLDIRNLELDIHENIEFIKSDLFSFDAVEAFDSISCLHTIEHIGLGRYGDEIDPDGPIKAFGKLISILKKKGTLYLSFPIGRASKVIFNRHRIFTPTVIYEWVRDNPNVSIASFDFINDRGDLETKQEIEVVANLDIEYGCGVYTLVKE